MANSSGPATAKTFACLKWILERVEGKGEAEETPIGYVPTRNALTLDGLKITHEALHELFRVDPDDWEIDLADVREFFGKFGKRLPEELREEQNNLVQRLERALPA